MNGEDAVGDTRAEWTAFMDSMAVMAALGCAVIGLVWAMGSPDAGMAFHGWVFLAAAGVAASYVMSNMNSTLPPAYQSLLSPIGSSGSLVCGLVSHDTTL